MVKKAKKVKKIKRKINPFDVVIFFLVFCLILVFAYRLYTGVAKAPENNNSKYVVEFECEEEYNSMLEYLSSGDAVYLASSGELLGYLYEGDASIDGAVYEITAGNPTPENGEEDQNGSENSFYHSIRMGGWLKLNVDTVRVSSGDYYSIGEVNFCEGSKLEVYTEKAVFTITVSSISRNES